MQSQNISDIIEAYLKKILADNEQIEIRRSEIAKLFNCVPSQINYVINTRFTEQRGYVVNSKRGGGGYIRIVKVQFLDDRDFLEALIENVDTQISQADTLAIIQKLYDEQILSQKEGNLILAATSPQTLAVNNKQLEEQLRAQILVAVLERLRYEIK
ncbi:CtsR family transcriptional regulator [Latilactobacillus curvatus]|uniref:Transcriptional regulator CtsR n=2 Tax=Latilactobacillus curvatus TaxID=28038 RepID=A0A0B2XL11_LATCU|nr:CtsR family transcriptional regulator [Latilactobacillus curvatus]MDT3394689.1 CtsR family transcriptional regulator [Bacillota bacterium]ANJ70098.1 CtsR family transcriptional regulator [Latilactobacillus curvatus]ANY13038.1 CtsR family transcriptional regulator [Latilactobacillus curvatus]AOO74737.1 CtsR family transcriptional regulator [Latilactobacillus curvatus]ASN59300.1 CtsR family transcriptional regulator [Latilactobacillus curvatus]